MLQVVGRVACSFVLCAVFSSHLDCADFPPLPLLPFPKVLPSPHVSEPLDSPLCEQVSGAAELLQFLLLFGNKATIGFMDGAMIRGDPILK